jgi:Predicted integral membrane protein (DUF2269)
MSPRKGPVWIILAILRGWWHLQLARKRGHALAFGFNLARMAALPELRHAMDFLLLRFAHLVGLMLMSAGLIGVFVADMRSRQIHEVKLFAQAVTFIAVFYDGLVVPGALLLLASGTWLIASYYGVLQRN